MSKKTKPYESTMLETNFLHVPLSGHFRKRRIYVEPTFKMFFVRHLNPLPIGYETLDWYTKYLYAGDCQDYQCSLYVGAGRFTDKPVCINITLKNMYEHGWISDSLMNANAVYALKNMDKQTNTEISPGDLKIMEIIELTLRNSEYFVLNDRQQELYRIIRYIQKELGLPLMELVPMSWWRGVEWYKSKARERWEK